MDLVELTAGDRNNRYQRAALVLRTLGWLSIVWGVMISMWIMVGERAGSQLWLWWTAGQFVFGAVCLAVAGRLQTRSAHFAGNRELENERRDRAA